MSAWDAVPFVLLLIKLLLVGVSIVFFVSGIDDCFVDLVFAARALYRRCAIASTVRPLTWDDLLANAEKPIAVTVPAWREAAAESQPPNTQILSKKLRAERVLKPL